MTATGFHKSNQHLNATVNVQKDEGISYANRPMQMTPKISKIEIVSYNNDISDTLKSGNEGEAKAAMRNQTTKNESIQTLYTASIKN